MPEIGCLGLVKPSVIRAGSQKSGGNPKGLRLRLEQERIHQQGAAVVIGGWQG